MEEKDKKWEKLKKFFKKSEKMRYERKQKICVGCDTMQFIYAHKMCRRCYGSGFKKKPKKVKPAFGFTSEKELFIYVWNLSEIKECTISGEDLTKFAHSPRFWSCFAHILPKSMYGKFRLRPDNLMLVHPDIHTLIDQGTEEQRKGSGYDFSPFYEKQEELKQEYLKL